MQYEAKMVWVSAVLAMLALASIGQAATTIIMDASHNNGSLTYDGNQAPYGDYWNYNPGVIPAGWTYTTGFVYSTGYSGRGKGLIEIGTAAQAVNNTGIIVHAGQRFTVSADLGAPGTNPTVEVLATQNADGTGTEFLLADVNQAFPAGSPPNPYILTTTPGTPGLSAIPRLEGYYVQVRLATSGYYDNVVVTSEDWPITTYTYMQAVQAFVAGESIFHNGQISAPTVGLWSKGATPYDWSTTDPNHTSTFTWYTGAFLFAGFDSNETVTNNTGEIVPAGHQFTIQADLGGVTGATAQAFAYATQNIDGTGAKVLLAEVNRPGTEVYPAGTSTGSSMSTVQGAAGPRTSSSVAGYYVQVILKTAGAVDVNEFGYYRRISVTSVATPGCGDANHPYPSGDINQDCHVSFADFALLADQWLVSCTGPNWCHGADLKHVGIVNFKDLSVFVENWLDCTDPNAPCNYKPL
jgi:hypothetical protein